MLTLLSKDFKLLFGKEKGITKRILSIVVSFIFISCFVAIEVFLFTTILKEIGNIYQASITFMNLFLAIISVLIILSDLFRAEKLFFDEKDIEQLSVHPVSNSAIICSKLIFLLITHYTTSIIFVYPLFIAYGNIVIKGVWFYYLGLFYPLLSFLFEMGIALLFVYPFHLLQKFMKKHLIARFVICLVTLFIGTFIYSKVLNLFIQMVASNTINRLFTTDSINRLIQLRKYEFPTNFLTDIFINKSFSKLFPLLAISIGVFILGLSIVIFAFNYVRNISLSSVINTKEKKYVVLNPKKALIKKELILLAKNPSYTFSFTGLLIIQPFLALLVIQSLNTIFTTGIFAYYISVVPNFIPLMDILLLMLFTLIISQGASQYISMEEKTIKVIKTIPVKVETQLAIKVFIPLILSEISFIVTLFVLLIGKEISIITFLFGFIIVTILLIIFNLISLREELHIRNRKPRSTFKSNLYSYLLPIAYFVITAVLSYFRLNIVLAYVIGIVTIILLGIPQVIYLKKKTNDLFMDLDMVN